MGKFKYDIFLSHSSSDNAFADSLNDLLVKSGFKVWYDNNSLLLGTNLDEIFRCIEASQFVIVIWSTDAEQSEWVRNEAQTALLNKKTVIVVRLDDKDDYPYCLKDLKNIKWLYCQNGSLTPDNFFRILAAIYRTSENTEFENDVFVTLSWHDGQEIIEQLFPILRREFRLIGDYPDQESTVEQRIKKIMGTCRGYIALLTERDDEEYLKTSKYFWTEIKLAKECDLPGLLIAAPIVFSKIKELVQVIKSPIDDNQIKQLKNEKGWFTRETDAFVKTCIEALKNYELISYEDKCLESRLDDCLYELSRSLKSPKTPYIYYTENTGSENNSFIKRLCGIVTAIPCKGESDSVNRANTSTIDRVTEDIKNAYLMISDVSNIKMDRYVDIGIAYGAGIELCLFKQQDSASTSAYIRDRISTYQDGCECLAVIHKSLRPYRRKVLFTEQQNTKEAN
ncbi:MAG: toll/interleukin-1 receptor domain-containing protein [Bacteroidales bacterium]|nr:toll/interleukin-1 receptor domain-containing protein [Bacteroidales bacterium]